MLSIYNTTKEITDSGVDTAVIPLGSVEGKGPHLPLGSDLILAEAFAREYCRHKNVYLTPTIPFGTSECQRGFAGTVYLENETLWSIICDLVEYLGMHGFKRVVILNFCSYNWVVKPCVRELNLGARASQGESPRPPFQRGRKGSVPFSKGEERTACPHCHVVWVEPRRLVEDVAAERVGRFADYHAGALETSLILHLDESLVTEPVEDFLPHLGREYLDYMGMRKVSPTGVWGRPSLASKELGEELFLKMLKRTDAYIRDALSLFDSRPGGQGDKEKRRSPYPPVSLPPCLPISRRSFYESPAQDQKSDTLDWTKSCREIAEQNPDIGLVTLAAIEQHSHHLPLGTDFFSSVVRSRRLAEEIGAYLLPPLPVVTSWSHTGFRGTLTFRSLTARRLIMDVVNSLYEGGFRKIAVMIAHGGNWIAKPTVIELNRKYPDLKLIYTGGDPLSYRGQARVDGVHCGPGETAFIMDYYPECLKQPIEDFSPKAPASYMDYVGMRGVSPMGVWGFPSKAKKGMGFQSVQNSVERMSEYIKANLLINKR